ncbi:DNA helicase-2/ATP-dependent DNA helicase PcrA [Peptoniphilus olsenii]|uniref:DNA 3'-5' helicase n=1 Tax=Peptoniphilus olsenii TaxID=411570 RepID=A0ABV2J9L4_9FIRM
MLLTENQLKAIEHFEGPAIVLAVPGAGKTTILLHRTKRLIERGVDPAQILTITFSKAQALDIKNRFSELCPKVISHFATIHAFCYRIVRDYAMKKGKTYNLIDSNVAQKYEIMRSIYRQANNAYPTEEVLETAFMEIGYCKNAMLRPTSYAKNKNCETSNFVKVFNLYEDYKNQHNLIDFDDMIIKAYYILKSDIALCNKYRNMFKFIQLDEGQDTSHSQFLVLKLLSKPNDNFLVVADDDQSIYGFRGANPHELLNLQKEYKNIKTLFMENNFRSSKNIVNTSNIFIDQNKDRYKKNIITDNSFNEPVSIIKVKEPKNQYEFIKKEIENYDGDVAVLYRNNLSSIGLVEYFERNNIKFNIKDKKTKFFSHFITRDMIDILNFSRDLSNIELYEKFYYKLIGYISRKHIDYLKKHPGKNIFNVLKEYPYLPDYYHKNINKLNSCFKRVSRSNVYDAINFIDKEMGYGNYLKENSKRFRETIESLNEYLYYLKLIAKNSASIELFLGRLKELEYILKKPKESDVKVTFSTIHSSKGLEFSKVFVIDLYEGTLPSNTSLDLLGEDESLFEEERRIFYVAMTRAKKELFLVYSHYRNGIKNDMSSFLKDLETLAGDD